MADLRVRVAGLDLANPVMAGSGEATASREDLLAAIDAGAAAVVAKSTNASERAREQLRRAEYALLDERWRARSFDPREHADRPDEATAASLLNRSGLVDVPFDDWLEILVEVDRHARGRNAYVVGSLIPSHGRDESARMAKEMQAAGIRWIELNVGAPHAGEASGGAIRAGTDAEQVADLVRPVRDAVDLPLTVKIAGEGDVLGAAGAAAGSGADAVCLTGRHLGFMPDLETRRPILGTFGAIGGPWALPLTLRWVAKARGQLGPAVPLIGTNGARDGLDVARFLLAGASAAQMTTAVLLDGPVALTKAISTLDAYLDDRGVGAASDLIGQAADRALTYEEAGR